MPRLRTGKPAVFPGMMRVGRGFVSWGGKPPARAVEK